MVRFGAEGAGVMIEERLVLILCTVAMLCLTCYVLGWAKGKGLK